MASNAPARPRRGPAPIASFDHDNSDESSPEGKATARLPEIREQLTEDGRGESGLTESEGRGRALSAPGLCAAPRIDISRASSSSQQDSRDSSPELALFAAGADPATLGFREDGALDLRSSTEELSFLETGPAAPTAPPGSAAPPCPAALPGSVAPPGPAAPPGAAAPRRHSRKDSQGSEAALLVVSGRTSRLSSVGSACSGASHVSRLSVVSGASRSPSPHRMLLETSFCGPRPLDAEPELCATAEQARLLGLAPDRRDQRRVRTEAAVEPQPPPGTATPPMHKPPTTSTPAFIVETAETHDEQKKQKEYQNRATVEERRSRPKLRREPSEPEVYRSANRQKNVVRIRLKPKEEYDENDVEEDQCPSPSPAATTAPAGLEPRKPATLELRPVSPTPGPASRKSSFCSLFRSRETIASPESPLRRKRSLTESRSRSRERSRTPTSAKLRGSVLALFRGPRRASAPRAASPRVERASSPPRPPALLYYEEAQDGIIHIPLRTPPDEAPGSPRPPRPASAPQPRAAPASTVRPMARTVLPDGSIIIPLHSPTERAPPSDEVLPAATLTDAQSTSRPDTVLSRSEPQTTVSVAEMRTPTSHASTTTPISSSVTVTPLSPPATTDATSTVCSSAARSAATDCHRSRREHIVFTTHVGSAERVFSTQLSLTKSPSISSENSSTHTYAETEQLLRDTRIGSPATSTADAQESPAPREESGSESEAGSEASTQAGSEAEVRGLVVQESFEELPYVATTLPQERPLALPMVPVRERGGVHVAALQRPRPPAPAPALRAAAPHAAPPPGPTDKLHIRLPRRPRPASAPDRPDRRRTISGNDGGAEAGADVGGAEAARAEWVDFAESGERRRAARRIQTLPARSYVTPEDCRCRCHNHHNLGTSNGSSPECEGNIQQETTSDDTKPFQSGREH